LPLEHSRILKWSLVESNHVLGIFSPAHTPSLPKLLTDVAPDGIEPPLADPESAALPLCDRASLRRLKDSNL
jgi:hypothetical protein